MNYVRLGRTGLRVSEYCVGGDNFGGQTDEAEALQIMGAAFDGGVNFIDTANTYMDGRYEEIIGKFIQGQRYDVVLATKGNHAVGEGPNEWQVSRKYVMRAIDDSLRRLRTDYIDLYQIHTFPVDIPIDEFVQAYSDVVQAGKARYIGVSNFAGYQLVDALWQVDRMGARRFDCVQPRYNLLCRDPERELLPVCAEYGVGVIPYSPQAGGFLLGKHRNFQAEAGGRFSDSFRAWEWYRSIYWFQPMFDAMEEILGVSERYGVSMNALVLHWVISNPTVTACIVGSRTAEQLRSNLAAWQEDVPQEALDDATRASEAVRATYAQV